jgi:hypothetical protein
MFSRTCGDERIFLGFFFPSTFPVYAALLLYIFSFLFYPLLVIFLTCYPLPSSRLLNAFCPLLNFLLPVSVRRMWKQEAITFKTVPAELKGPKGGGRVATRLWPGSWRNVRFVILSFRRVVKVICDLLRYCVA